jgi:single-stranded DNA-binding protein
LSRGTNSWHGSGQLVSDVKYGGTRNGGPACSFRIAINQLRKPTIYIRVNVYGGNVEVCRKFTLGKGDFVVVAGELMSRNGKDEVLTEVRCRDIVIKSEGERNGNVNG